MPFFIGNHSFLQDYVSDIFISMATMINAFFIGNHSFLQDYVSAADIFISMATMINTLFVGNPSLLQGLASDIFLKLCEVPFYRKIGKVTDFFIYKATVFIYTLGQIFFNS